MKTILLTTLLAVSPSFALAAGAPAEQPKPAPVVSIQVDAPRYDSLLRVAPGPAWDITFAGLPLSTWTRVQPVRPEPTAAWTGPAATPAITLFSIRF